MLSFIIDTSAIQRYATDTGPVVAPLLAHCTENDCAVITPATCVSEAYWAADNETEPMLDLFTELRQVRLVPLEAADASTVGGMARFLGGLGMAHACLLAASLRITLLTAEPALARKMLDSSLVWEV